MRPWCCLVWAPAEGQVWVHVPGTSGVCAEVHGVTLLKGFKNTNVEIQVLTWACPSPALGWLALPLAKQYKHQYWCYLSRESRPHLLGER